MAIDTVGKLDRITSKERKIKESELCECGHPKYMHHYSIFTKRIGHCRVHGCRPNDNNPDGCKKFKLKEVSVSPPTTKVMGIRNATIL